MPKLTFFRQERVDGGVRMGISVADATVLHHFEPGTADDDPALLWYVDVRCDGSKIPREAEDARHWLVEQSATVTKGIRALAERLRAGADEDIIPISMPIPDAPAGTRIVVACSAVRHVAARDIAAKLRDLETHWKKYLKKLSATVAASR